jgi:manganese transport protein
MALLIFVTFSPLFKRHSIRKKERRKEEGLHLQPSAILSLEKTTYRKIAVAVDFSSIDPKVLQQTMSLATPESEILLIHIVESVVARVFGKEVADNESQDDLLFLQTYQSQMQAMGYQVSIKLGFGNPKKTIPEITTNFGADLLILGSHGHGFWEDLLLGTTIDKVRHRVEIPVFIVREAQI